MKEKLYCTPSQMREIEKASEEAGRDCHRLMENAGSAAAVFIMNIIAEQNLSGMVTVLCGKGNNGGDGFVAARDLSEAGLDVCCVNIFDTVSTDLAKRELYELTARRDVPVLSLEKDPERAHDAVSSSSVIVDAVFGTGFHGELPKNAADIFALANSCRAVRIALDIPSGGNGGTGYAAEGTFCADHTVTFGLEKIGTAMLPLKNYCGKVTTADIGIPRTCIKSVDRLIRLLDSDTVKEMIPVRPYNAHKGMYGKLLDIAGSRTMPGAAALSVRSALRSGAGLVTLASVGDVVRSLSSSIYECTYLPLKTAESGSVSSESIPGLLDAAGKASAVAIGCGLMVTEDTKNVVSSVINGCEKPLIIDADGLNCIAPCIDIIRNAKGGAVVTPHPGELARLLGISTADVTADRLGAAMRFNSLYETAILAKGSPTFIVGNENAYVSFTGNPGLSRGGSGDVLTGIIGGLAAMGLSPEKAAACGAYIHGRAADLAAERLSVTGMLPSDVTDELPFVFREMDR